MFVPTRILGRRSIWKRLWFLVVVGIAASGLPCGSFAGERTFPGKSWEVKEPGALGMDAARLEALARALSGRGCVVKDGFVVKTWGSQSEKKDWYSSAKPVLSTLLFFAIQEGKVAGVDAKVIDAGWKLSEKDAPMTFAHLANMVSGYARPGTAGSGVGLQRLRHHALPEDAVRPGLPGRPGQSRGRAVRAAEVRGRAVVRSSPSAQSLGARLRADRLVLVEQGTMEW